MSAEDFSLSAELLHETSSKRAIPPQIVCATLAVELYLKAWIATYSVVDRFDEHLLNNLFGSLTQGDQQLIIDKYNTQPDVVALRSVCMDNGYNPGSLDLLQVLTVTAKNFVKWRYHHETPINTLTLNNLAIVRRVLHECLMGKHPEWGVEPEKFYESKFPVQNTLILTVEPIPIVLGIE